MHSGEIGERPPVGDGDPQRPRVDALGRDERFFVHRDGRTTEGTADPRWWLGATPAGLAKVRS